MKGNCSGNGEVCFHSCRLLARWDPFYTSNIQYSSFRNCNKLPCGKLKLIIQVIMYIYKCIQVTTRSLGFLGLHLCIKVCPWHFCCCCCVCVLMSSRFSPPWSSMSWTRSGGAMTSCPISGIPASMIWWVQPLDGIRTDQTASQSFRL